MMMHCLLLAAALATGEQPAERTPDVARPFARPFALGAALVGWGGASQAAGVGGKLRWEISEGAGLEAFSEHVLVEDAVARHDHPVGVGAYAAFPLFRDAPRRVRLRPMAAVFLDPSFRGPGTGTAVRAGGRAGLGIEIALDERVSWYADALVAVVIGRAPEAVRPLEARIGGYGASAYVQPATGLAFHFGER